MMQKNIFLLYLLLAFTVRTELFAQNCLRPTNIQISQITPVGATISWLPLNNPIENQWEMSVGAQGFNVAQPLFDTILTTPSVQLQGLNPVTKYEFYVRAKCSPTDFSLWAGPFSFISASPNPSNCSLSLEIPDFVFGNPCKPLDFPIFVTGINTNNLGISYRLSEVRFIIRHTWDSDLILNLSNPSGNTVELVHRRGFTLDNFGNPDSIDNCRHFTAIIRNQSPAACDAKPISKGTAPFIGNFLGEQNLDILNDFSNPNGAWKLSICDTVSGDKGKLEFAQLIFEPVYCAAPSHVTFSNVTENSVQVSWNNIDSCNNIILEYGISGFAPGTTNIAGMGNIVTIPCGTPQPYTLSGLLPLNKYDIYLRKICTSGNVTANSCRDSVETNCPTNPITISETFDNQLLCTNNCGDACAINGLWTNISRDDFDWIIGSQATNTNLDTGPSDDISGGGKYLLLQSAGSICGNNKKAILQSNCLKINASNRQCSMSFFYNMYGVNVNRLSLDASRDGGLTWQNLWTLAGDQSTVWHRQYIDLQQFSSDTIQLRFVGLGGVTNKSDIALDQIEFYGATDLGAAPNIYFADSDGDNFGNPNNFIRTCKTFPPQGFVTNNLDCDDTNNTIYPNAPEIFCNKIDENCNGMSDDNIFPNPIIIGDTTICQNEFTLMAAQMPPKGNYYWYDNTLRIIHVGNSFQTPILTTSETYYVKDSTSLNPGLRITEVNISEPDGIEIQNIGSAQNFSGWVVAASNSISNINIVHPQLWNLGIMSSNQILFKNDTSTNPNLFWGGNLIWNPGASAKGWVLLVDNLGTVRDAIFWGWNVTQIANFNTNINGFSLNATNLPWSGNGFIAGSCGTGKSISLATSNEQNTLADYEPCSTALNSMGFQNPNLSLSYVCQSGYQPITVRVNQRPVLFVSTPTPICEGDIFNLNTLSIIDSNNTNGTVSFHSGLPCAASNQLSSLLINPVTNTIYYIKYISSSSCIVEKSVQIIVKPKPQINVTNITNLVVCNSDSVLLTTSIQSGVAPFKYRWNTGDTSNYLSVKGTSGSGIKTVYVVDNQQCKDTATVNITVPSPINVSLDSIKGVSTCSAADGAIYLFIFGGNPPYTINWSGNTILGSVSGTYQSNFLSSTLQNLSQGTYNFNVTDLNGCSQSLNTISINSPTTALRLDSVTAVNCYGENTGKINISAIGMNPLQSAYTWSNGQTTRDSLSNIPAGTYSVTVSDANCTNVLGNIVVTQPSFYNINLLQIEPQKCNILGKISISVQGGTPPYSYLWSNGLPTQNISNLLSNQYSVQVKDQKNCTLNQSFNVLLDTNIFVTFLIDSVICNGKNNGKITAAVTSGIAPFRFLWSNGDTTNNIQNLSAGTYRLTLTDAAFCIYKSPPIAVGQPNILKIDTLNFSANACGQTNNGRIDIGVRGGTAPYRFFWDDAATSEDRNMLPNAAYSVVVKDRNQCADTAFFNLQSPAPPRIFVTNIQPPACVGSLGGVVQTVVSGGVSPYGFLWSNGTSNATLNGVDTGLFALKVTDFNGCVDTISVRLSAPQVMNITNFSATNATCFGGNDGRISFNLTGGISPFSYSWSNGQSTLFPFINNLPTGNYYLITKDANGCAIKTPTIFINSPPPINIFIDTVINNNCFNAQQGSIKVHVTGGVIPYKYYWNNIVTNNKDLTNIFAGSYSLFVLDSNNCVSGNNNLFPIRVLQPDSISAKVTVVGAGCSEINQTGTVRLSVLGGNPPYNYVWSNGTFLDSLSGIDAGFYSVTIYDSKNCQKIISNIEVKKSFTKLLLKSISPKQLKCVGDTNGEITVEIEGGLSPYQYNWSAGENHISNSLKDTIKNLSSNFYNVTITDNNGCILTSPFLTLSNPQPISIRIDSIYPVKCKGQSNGQIFTTALGGAGGFSFNWSNGSTLEDPNLLAVGNYFLTVTDSFNCTFSGQQAVVILEPTDSLQYSVLVTKQPTCHNFQDGQITLSAYGGYSPYHIQWNNPALTDLFSLNQLGAGTYFASIIDSKGCSIKVDTFRFNNPQPLLVTKFITSLQCPLDSNGSISLASTGGEMPYYFLWSNGDTTNFITGLSAGFYEVTIKDSRNCVVNENFIPVIQPDIFSINATTTDANAGQNDGTATLNVTGGTPNYQYFWSGGQTSNPATQLQAGFYNVTIIDSQGCHFTKDSIEIRQSTSASSPSYGMVNIQISPNPSNGIFNLQIQNIQNIKNCKIKLKLKDVRGAVIFEEKIIECADSQVLNLEYLSAGIYFLEFLIDDKVFAQKLFIQN